MTAVQARCAEAPWVLHTLVQPILQYHMKQILSKTQCCAKETGIVPMVCRNYDSRLLTNYQGL